jgi:hypothetical protein
MAIPLPGGVRIKVATQLTAELGKVIKAYGTKWQGSGFLDPPFAVRILAPQPATQVSATRFPGAAEVSTFQRVWPIRASLCRPVQGPRASKEPVMPRQSQGVIFNFRFGMPETGSTGD